MTLLQFKNLYESQCSLRKMLSLICSTLGAFRGSIKSCQVKKQVFFIKKLLQSRCSSSINTEEFTFCYTLKLRRERTPFWGSCETTQLEAIHHVLQWRQLSAAVDRFMRRWVQKSPITHVKVWLQFYVRFSDARWTQINLPLLEEVSVHPLFHQSAIY